MNETTEKRAPKWPFFALSALAIVILAGSAIYGNLSTTSPQQSAPTATATPKATPKAETINKKAEKCAASWATAPSDYTNNRWFGEGLASIRDATTNQQASAAAADWLNEVRKDPVLLSATAKNVLKQDIPPAALSSNGCATESAVELVANLQLTFASSKVTPGNAPVNGYNTGVENGVVVGSPSPGINGNRKAIQITLPDGTTIWIMARCGNIVTSGPPPLPRGHTDQCPPGETGTFPICKDTEVKGPAHNPAFPTQQKPNPLPATSAAAQPTQPAIPPVTYTPPPVATATPAPVGNIPAPTPIETPRPIATPEPAAPAPATPVDTCSPPPGETTCK